MFPENNFTIRDNNSEFAKLLQSNWIEPLTIIARIKGYNGIDTYILQLIKSRLDMFVETGDTIEYSEFQEYMHNTINGKDVPNEWASHKEEMDKDAKEFVKQVQENYHDMKESEDRDKEDLK
jgi:hypothetical protein